MLTDSALPPPPIRRASNRRPVPIRTMVAVVASVLVTVIGVEILIRLHQVVVWTLVSALFAIVLHPPVNLLVRKLKFRRSLAALVVFVLATVMVVGLGYEFVRPLVDQANIAVKQFPGYVSDARAGRGTVGHLVKKYDIVNYVNRNEPALEKALKSAEKPAVQAAEGILNTLTALAAIVVMTFLLLIEGPKMMSGGVAVLSPPNQQKVRTVVRDVVRALAGYMGGLLVRSILNGVVTYVALWVLGIPFRGVLALWIAFMTLIPVVGVFLGLVPAAVVGFIHSTPAGIAIVAIVLVFYLLEKKTLDKRVNARTIDLSPLGVAVSIVAGFQLLGFLGVFLAIPVAGLIHVVIRDLWSFHQARIAGAAVEG